MEIGGVTLRHKVTSTNYSRKDYLSREITGQFQVTTSMQVSLRRIVKIKKKIRFKKKWANLAYG